MTIEEAMKRTVGTCRYDGCLKTMIPASVWRRVTPEQRKALKDQGFASHKTRGLCVKHTDAAQREGIFDSFSKGPAIERMSDEAHASLVAKLEPVPCVGPDCSKQVVIKKRWVKVEERYRLALVQRGYACHETRGLCYTCYAAARSAGTLETFPQRPSYSQKPTTERFDVPAMWAELKEEGGSLEDMSQKLGISVERVRQIFHELGLDLPRKVNVARREDKLEEIHFLHSCGMGVHEMAVKLDTTDEALIDYVDKARQRGQSTLNLHYNDYANA